MKVSYRHLPATALVAVLICAAPALSGTPQAPQEEPAQEPALQEPAAEVVTGLEAEGELRAIDADQSILLVVGSDGTEMLFHVDADTQVEGESEGVQGLSGQAGTTLHIDYRAEGTRAIAESIQVTGPAPDAQPASPAEAAEEQPNP